VEWPEPNRLRLQFVASTAVATRAADLVVRETACCSVFTFTLTASGGRLSLDVAVPAGQIDVVRAIAARVRACGRQ
jgi:hypothetical protein